MIPVLLILVPLLSGFASFLIKSESGARSWSLLSAIITLAISILGLTAFSAPANRLLTAISFPLIFVATWFKRYEKAPNFFALMLLTQAGLMGVFVAQDALLFYFFWELALIPTYFLCSRWGGERRIPVTFKFFIYTFVGSLMMLVGIIYLYSQTPDGSFSINSFYNLKLPYPQQSWVFWLFFVAFAVKMPIFPFHTWQPDAYEQSPTATTMVLSGIMVKMGVFAVLRWLVPVLPLATWAWGDTVAMLSVIGMLYASLIAIRQDDLKRLVAYSSIAHIGLMSLAIFVPSQAGIQGVMIQMFAHGINIIGLWIVVELIERQFGTRKMSELGGIAQKAPMLTLLLVIIAFANVALPLTNAFIGEFLMFSGVFSSEASKYSMLFAALACITIILSAVYTLNMIQRVFYGNTNAVTGRGIDIKTNESLALIIIVGLILSFGVYPGPMLELTESVADSILSTMMVKQP
ncbi:MAG: NADH-quinone oxidoreductase subunit M [Chitinophagaceae bacterium]|nr:MAG: NADH-quinone oxidoreductase subunit M [Chitinophagaceae bacterium]